VRKEKDHRGGRVNSHTEERAGGFIRLLGGRVYGRGKEVKR